MSEWGFAQNFALMRVQKFQHALLENCPPQLKIRRTLNRSFFPKASINGNPTLIHCVLTLSKAILWDIVIRENVAIT